MIQLVLGIAILCAIPFLSDTAGKVAALLFAVMFIWIGINETSKKNKD